MEKIGKKSNRIAKEYENRKDGRKRLQRYGKFKVTSEKQKIRIKQKSRKAQAGKKVYKKTKKKS